MKLDWRRRVWWWLLDHPDLWGWLLAVAIPAGVAWIVAAVIDWRIGP